MNLRRWLVAALAASALGMSATVWKPADWPVLRHYDSRHLYRVALPLGGIGTGTVSLGGRGELRDWEIMNVPAKGYSTVTPGNNAPFFAIYAQPEGGSATTTLLAGPLSPAEYQHYEGRPVDHHGLPRFAEASFDAAYPFGQVHLSDPSLPVEVTVKGFNPLVPGDADASGLPVAVLSYAVTNKTGQAVDVAVCGSMRNFVGRDGSRYTNNWKGDFIPLGARRNENEYRSTDSLAGLFLYSDSVDHADPAWGTIALTTQPAGQVTWRTASVPDDWSNAMLNFWDDFSADGLLTEPQAQRREDDPMASLAVKRRIAPGATETFTFYLTWHFPNRKAWSSTVVGNYYCQQFRDAWDAACGIVPRIPELEAQTLAFVRAFLSTSLPDEVKEAALFNLSTLRSQTVFRLPDGHLMGWEGVMDRYGSCAGSCTHVWNYETATAYLFGELARSMRDVELTYATRPDGLMNFRAALPLSEAAKGSSAAADGQMGCVMKLYREWQFSGDDSFLRRYYEPVRRVLSYAWKENGWDADQDGVMEGSQHNTMDVNYFGPNPQMGFWYLGALRAGEEMARAMGDKAFATKCRRLFEHGSTWLDDSLFNGEYYEHRIYDPQTSRPVDTTRAGTQASIPAFQLGPGCLVDQLVGQYMAHLCGLGYLARPEHVRQTMQSIMKYNFVPDFSRHFNNMRSYVLGDESGLLMASWPKGRLRVPFPYFAEVMTGFEYCAATGMIYEGLTSDALTCVRAIRSRFDGARRNPFDEPECGHHYARAMASWSLVVALADFQYSGVEQRMGFTSTPGTYFWSNGASWGLCRISGTDAELRLLGGPDLRLRTLTVGGRDYRLRGFSLLPGEARTVRL